MDTLEPEEVTVEEAVPRDAHQRRRGADALARGVRRRAAASSRRTCARRWHEPNHATYMVMRIINYTNVCVAQCDYCAFYVLPNQEGGYVLSREDVFAKIDELLERRRRPRRVQRRLQPEAAARVLLRPLRGGARALRRQRRVLRADDRRVRLPRRPGARRGGAPCRSPPRLRRRCTISPSSTNRASRSTRTSNSAERVERAPVGRRRTAVEQAGVGVDQRAGADARHQRPARREVAHPLAGSVVPCSGCVPPPGRTSRSTRPTSAQRRVGEHPQAMRARDRLGRLRDRPDADVALAEPGPSGQHLVRPGEVELLDPVPESNGDRGTRPFRAPTLPDRWQPPSRKARESVPIVKLHLTVAARDTSGVRHGNESATEVGQKCDACVRRSRRRRRSGAPGTSSSSPTSRASSRNV